MISDFDLSRHFHLFYHALSSTHLETPHSSSCLSENHFLQLENKKEYTNSFGNSSFLFFSLQLALALESLLKAEHIFQFSE